MAVVGIAKKSVSIFLALALTVCFVPVVPAKASSDYTSGDFKYTLSGNDATITGYTGSATQLTVPATIDGHKVKSIGSRAFSGCESLSSVSLPASLDSLGDRAFRGCERLSSISLPEGLESMGYGVLEGTAVTEVTVPSTVSSASVYGPFSGCEGLARVAFAAGGKKLAADVLRGAASVVEVSIPAGVEEIGGAAFEGCAELPSVEIPAGVKTVGYEAFRGCEKLSSVTIPASVKEIGSSAFSGCEKLTIYGYEGSYAQTYANENSIPFNSLGNVPVNDKKTYASSYLPSKNGWGFGNYRAGTFSEDTYYRVFSKYNPVDRLMYSSKMNVGSGGMCHGLALSSALTFANMPSFSSWSYDHSLYSFGLPSTVTDGCQSLLSYSTLGIDLGEYVQECFLAQYLSSAQADVKNNKGASKVIAASMASVTTGAPIVISIRKFSSDDNGKKTYKGGHSLLPYRVEEDSGTGHYRIYVYDCNYPSFSDTTDSHYVELTRNTSGGFDWSYALSSSEVWDSSAGEISYWDNANLVKMWGYINASKNHQKISAKAIASEDDCGLLVVGGNSSTANASDGEKVAYESGWYSNDDGSSLVPVWDNSLEPDTSTAMYYVPEDEHKVTVFSGSVKAGSSVTYADDDGALTATTSGVSVATFDSLSCSVEFDGTQKVSFTQETVGGDRLTVSGSTSKDASAETSTENGSLVIAGFDKGFTVEKADANGTTTSTSTVESTEPSKEYRIDGDTGQVSENSKGDSKDDSKVDPVKPSSASLADATITGLSEVRYTGEAQEPEPTVMLGGKNLTSGTDYIVAYKNNVNVGTATVMIAGAGSYTGTKTATFTIAKALQPMTVKARKKTVKVSKAKKKAVKLKGCMTVGNAQGKVSYKNSSKGKKLKKFKVNAKSGAITVPKKTKKGTYKVKMRVTASGTSNYEAGSKTVTVKVLVK